MARNLRQPCTSMVAKGRCYRRGLLRSGEDTGHGRAAIGCDVQRTVVNHEGQGPDSVDHLPGPSNRGGEYSHPFLPALD